MFQGQALITINTLAIMEIQGYQTFYLSEARFVVLSSGCVGLSNLKYISNELIVCSKANYPFTKASPLQPFSSSHQDQILQ